MGYQVWLIAGIIMLAITYFVHKNTYSYKGEKLPFPLWGAILAVVIALIPVANVAVFLSGVFLYFMSMANDYIEFSCKSKWWLSVVKVMTRNLNKDE
jgi:hypothetical protein